MEIKIRKIIKNTISAVSMSRKKFRKICDDYASSGKFLIIGYHRVKWPSKNEYIEPGMYVNPNTFLNQLKILGKYCEIVSLKEMYRCTENSKKPFCVLTFDDGWSDFYDNVYPLLLKYGYPATVFLPTEYIDSKRMFWTDALAESMIMNEINTSVLARLIKNENVKKKLDRNFNIKNIHELIDLIKIYSMEQDEDIIHKIEEEISPVNKGKERFLKWKQIEEMKNSNLICFGSHTSNHVILTAVSKKRLLSELLNSREILIRKNLVSSNFISFCYPNGFTNQKIADLVKYCGYSCAVTLQRGWNNRNPDLYMLKRIGMHQDVSFSSPVIISRLGFSCG